MVAAVKLVNMTPDTGPSRSAPERMARRTSPSVSVPSRRRFASTTRATWRRLSSTTLRAWRMEVSGDMRVFSQRFMRSVLA
jgi:hypothetical protein